VVEKRPENERDLHQAVEVLACRGICAKDVLHPDPVVFHPFISMTFQSLTPTALRV
jgi:hypothetical protein